MLFDLYKTLRSPIDVVGQLREMVRNAPIHFVENIAGWLGSTLPQLTQQREPLYHFSEDVISPGRLREVSPRVCVAREDANCKMRQLHIASQHCMHYMRHETHAWGFARATMRMCHADPSNGGIPCVTSQAVCGALWHGGHATRRGHPQGQL